MLTRYYFCSANDDGENCDMVVDANNEAEATSLYLAEVKRLDWNFEQIDRVWILPPMSDEPKAYAWGVNVVLAPA